MEAPRWRHIVTNDGYHKSVMAVVVAVVAKAVVDGCMAAVTVTEEADEVEEGEGAAKKFRR